MGERFFSPDTGGQEYPWSKAEWRDARLGAIAKPLWEAAFQRGAKLPEVKLKAGTPVRIENEYGSLTVDILVRVTYVDYQTCYCSPLKEDGGIIPVQGSMYFPTEFMTAPPDEFIG